jgi:hypothetical protein
MHGISRALVCRLMKEASGNMDAKAPTLVGSMAEQASAAGVFDRPHPSGPGPLSSNPCRMSELKRSRSHRTWKSETPLRRMRETCRTSRILNAFCRPEPSDYPG